MSDATVMLACHQRRRLESRGGGCSYSFTDELRRLAASKTRLRKLPVRRFKPTALVHEAWLRLVGDHAPSFKDREHFFRASAEAMRPHF